MHSDVDLRLLNTFVAVAREGGFTRAAEQLNVTQQTVSQQIRELEDVVGTPLFERTTRKVALTPAGATIYRLAPEMLADLARSIEAVRQASVGRHLRLGYVASLESAARRIIQVLRTEQPSARLAATEYWDEEAIAGVVESRIDIALAHCPDPPEGLEAMYLPEAEQYGAVIRADDELARHLVLAPSQLKDRRVALFPRYVSPTLYDVILAACRPEGAEANVVELEVVSRDLSLNVGPVIDGSAFALIPAHAAEALPPTLVWRRLSPPPWFGACLLSRRKHSADTAALLPVVSAALTDGHWPAK